MIDRSIEHIHHHYAEWLLVPYCQRCRTARVSRCRLEHTHINYAITIQVKRVGGETLKYGQVLVKSTSVPRMWTACTTALSSVKNNTAWIGDSFFSIEQCRLVQWARPILSFHAWIRRERSISSSLDDQWRRRAKETNRTNRVDPWKGNAVSFHFTQIDTNHLPKCWSLWMDNIV